MRAGTLHVMTPTYRPAGGVVKLMDYVTHALDAGFDISVWCPEPSERHVSLGGIERFAAAFDSGQVRFHDDRRLSIRRDDLVLFSFPDHYEVALRSLPRSMSPHRLIHIVQGVRHTTPTWRDGYPLRLLTRPASRISINHIVAERISPWLDRRGIHETIPLGHDAAYFIRDPSPNGLGLDPSRELRVAHTTWKSDVGDRVAELLKDEPGYSFRAVRQTASWTELRELYHWADVFLCTPGAEEGLYLPGVEAMAAGCLVVTPDVGGNMAYCRPERNCLLVRHESERDYVAALRRIAGMSSEEAETMRRFGLDVVDDFSLEQERRLFHRFLGRVWAEVEVAEGTPVRS